jgi:hypothetical protein
MMKKVVVADGISAAALSAPLAVAGIAAPAPNKATGSVTWDLDQGRVTGTVKFDSNNKTGGSLGHQASNGTWLHGVVTPGSYQKFDAHASVFAGEITSGSAGYTVNHDGTHYFPVKVVDGGTSGRNGDVIAVFANMDGHGNWHTSAEATTTVDYPRSDTTAGIVTGCHPRTAYVDAVSSAAE